MKYNYYLLLIAGVFAAGCSFTSNEPVEQMKVRTYANTHTPIRDASNTWEDDTLRGAAYVSEGYTHTLTGAGLSLADNDDNVPSSASLALLNHDASTSLPDSENVSKLLADPTGYAESVAPVPVSYSVYEMARWKRLCEGKPTIADLRLLAKATPAGVPATLETCVLPTFDEELLKQSWAKQCSGATLTAAEQHVVSHSQNPSTCN